MVSHVWTITLVLFIASISHPFFPLSPSIHTLVYYVLDNAPLGCILHASEPLERGRPRPRCRMHPRGAFWSGIKAFRRVWFKRFERHFFRNRHLLPEDLLLQSKMPEKWAEFALEQSFMSISHFASCTRCHKMLALENCRPGLSWRFYTRNVRLVQLPVWHVGSFSVIPLRIPS
jgi:hypothetical protein